MQSLVKTIIINILIGRFILFNFERMEIFSTLIDVLFKSATDNCHQKFVYLDFLDEVLRKKTTNTIFENKIVVKGWIYI